jgi:mono/diheme cytochrome c family protein
MASYIVIRPLIRTIRSLALVGAIAAVLSCALCAFAGETPEQLHARGEKIFNTRCIFCHGVGLGHPGWQMLDLKKGRDKAEILGRSDLTPAYIKQVVRDGNIEMPPFRPSEISDSDLNALADYVIHPHAPGAAH